MRLSQRTRPGRPGSFLLREVVPARNPDVDLSSTWGICAGKELAQITLMEFYRPEIATGICALPWAEDVPLCGSAAGPRERRRTERRGVIEVSSVKIMIVNSTRGWRNDRILRKTFPSGPQRPQSDRPAAGRGLGTGQEKIQFSESNFCTRKTCRNAKFRGSALHRTVRGRPLPVGLGRVELNASRILSGGAGVRLVAGPRWN